MARYNGTEYAITVDPKRDLFEGGHDNGDEACDAFFDAYCEAAEQIAGEHGIEIEVIRGRFDGPDSQGQTDHGDEVELWQHIHNRLRFDGKSWVVKTVEPTRA